MRVAVVEPSPAAVEAIRRALHGAGHAIAWVTHSADETLRFARLQPPDAILMALLPEDHGATIRRLMAESPCAIFVVTPTVSGNYDAVVEALSAGAADALATPAVGPDGTVVGGEALLKKLASVERKLRNSGEFRLPPVTPPPPPPVALPPLVAVGASTGGPQVLAAVLAELPADFPAAVVVAQHLDADFSDGLAHWLAGQISLSVCVVEADDPPRPGVVHLAGRNDHLVLKSSGRLGYTADPEELPYRPSVDVLFTSLAAVPRPGAAVLLTGMGRDGAVGLAKLRRLGWLTLCQDAASCAVFGMPGEAIRLNAAQQVLPPVQIGRVLAQHFSHPRTRGKPS